MDLTRKQLFSLQQKILYGLVIINKVFFPRKNYTHIITYYHSVDEFELSFFE